MMSIEVRPIAVRRPLVSPARRRGAMACSARLTPALVDAPVRRRWPGNARELENTIARLLALSQGGLIDVDALDGEAPTDATGTETIALRERVAAFERGLIERALADVGGNQSEAARRLSVSRVTLIDKIRRHGL